MAEMMGEPSNIAWESAHRPERPRPMIPHQAEFFTLLSRGCTNPHYGIERPRLARGHGDVGTDSHDKSSQCQNENSSNPVHGGLYSLPERLSKQVVLPCRVPSCLTRSRCCRSTSNSWIRSGSPTTQSQTARLATQLRCRISPSSCLRPPSRRLV